MCRLTHRSGNCLDLVFTDNQVLLLAVLVSQLKFLITIMFMLVLELSKLCLRSLFLIKFI